MTLTNAHKLAATRLFLTAGDVDDLLAIALTDAHDPGMLRVVDLGAGSGTTALAILEARADAQVWTVDNVVANLHWAEANLKGFGIDIHLPLIAPRWTPWEGDAGAFGRLWYAEGRPLVDVLLHDASHEEKDVRRDLLAWLPNMRPDGVIWVHDYLPVPGGEAYPGVMAAVDDLVVEGMLRPLVGKAAGFGWIGMPGPVAHGGR